MQSGNIPLPSGGPIGYGAVADAMGADDDLLMFRRFVSLNARNLLYMQAELSHLESKLLALDVTLNELSRGLNGWEVPRSWDKMTGCEEGKDCLQLVNEIRGKLEQYNNALLSQASISALRKPRRRDWRTLNDFVDHNSSALKEKDKRFLQDRSYPDLVALGGIALDPMTSFLLKFFAHLFQTKEDQRRTQGILNFSSTSRVRGFVRILAVITSSLLPVLSIVVLYFIQSQHARLITIVAFSALCSLALTILTDARNAEIIATTAAYAAVQVVFVSGDFSN
ncbi:hypothetical protein F5Y01DRAFT_315859 [Xylaria sp. FL0043]|nr:hypothetical protein F5Y01DRAFT_315859 [Xylaria sp. FL0043]